MANGDAPPEALFRHWVHSREEDGEGTEVFRPDDFAFPPAFGRDGFELLRDGTFVQDDIGPADGIVQVRGRWTFTPPGRVTVSFDQGHEGYGFEVIAVDDASLRIRRARRRDDRGGTYAETAPVDETQLAEYGALPPAASFRRLDFDDASVITLRSFPPQYVLHVSGMKPFANMDVRLVPLVYIAQPEYWGIEVVGSLPGIGLPATAPYAVSLGVTNFIGTRGIEVIGATRSERIDIPGRQPAPGRCHDWTAWVDAEPPGRPTLHVSGECEFRTAGFTVELRRHVPQGITPTDVILDKIVTPPPGPAADVVTTVTVTYQEEAVPGPETVTILPDGVSVRVVQAV